MNRRDSDLWLFRTIPLSDPNNVIHGLKYGSEPNVGHTSVAVEAGKWPSGDVFSPAPLSGMTLAYDGSGYDPKDWYIDESPTLGGPDFTEPGTIPASLPVLVGRQDFERELFVQTGEQDFEDVPLGDEVVAIADWQIASTSTTNGIFTARVVSDVMGTITPRDGSTQWLRIRDQDSGEVRNEVFSPTIETYDIVGYFWTFWVNLEERPAGDGAHPAFMVQHANDGFENAWGVVFRPDDVCLVVTDFGGNPAAECVLGSPLPLGAWVKLEMGVDFDLDLIDVWVNDAPAALLPIDLAGSADPDRFRFSYQGGGIDNTGTILLDDLTVGVVPAAQPFFLAVAASATDNDVELAWDISVGEPGGGFMVYRQIDGSAETTVAGPLAPDSRRFQDVDLATGHTYRYTVGAVIDDATEIRSRPAIVEIKAVEAVVFKNLGAINLGNVVEVVWDLDVIEPIIGFRIYRQSSLSPSEVEISGEILPEGTRRFEDADVRGGQWYAHVVAAVTQAGQEIRSRQSFVAIPRAPLEILRVFPNPFGITTTLDFSLAESGYVTVTVYDVQGKLVRRLSEKVRREGKHSVMWNGRDASGNQVSTGTYFFKLETRGTTLTSKVVLVR
jgi:hypothetical protein